MLAVSPNRAFLSRIIFGVSSKRYGIHASSHIATSCTATRSSRPCSWSLSTLAPPARASPAPRWTSSGPLTGCSSRQWLPSGCGVGRGGAGTEDVQDVCRACLDPLHGMPKGTGVGTLKHACLPRCSRTCRGSLFSHDECVCGHFCVMPVLFVARHVLVFASFSLPSGGVVTTRDELYWWYGHRHHPLVGPHNHPRSETNRRHRKSTQTPRPAKAQSSSQNPPTRRL